MRAIVDAQTLELKARRTSLEGQEEVLRKEIAGLQESIRGYQAQVDGERIPGLALFREELEAKNTLMEKQLIKRSEILALMRSEAGLSGELGELLGRIGDAKEKIARAEQQIVQLRTVAAQKAIEELHTATAELDDVQEQILAAHDVVERTDVRAPVRGIVVKLHHHTAGGVVARRRHPAGAAADQRRTDDPGAHQADRRRPHARRPARAGAAVGAQPAPDADDRRHA